MARITANISDGRNTGGRGFPGARNLLDSPGLRRPERRVAPYRAVAFVVVWLAGRVVVPTLFFDPFGTLGGAFVAILDVALVLLIFKSDIRLT
jgi:hypothetical protein